MLAAVKKATRPTAILFENAVDLMFEIYLMRGDCSILAKSLMARNRLDELSLEECARLDDTLATAFKSLQATLKSIQDERRSRSCKQ